MSEIRNASINYGSIKLSGNSHFDGIADKNRVIKLDRFNAQLAKFLANLVSRS